ncbi:MULTISPECIES: preprotein translocase subunit SecA [Clostridiaceae]|uniref:Protein translocase subunit SecA n=1 Tax=Clostridium facile TaxID=2763035 RepID=A0ABR7IQP2_9CLOT|nr:MULTISPECIES: preprotein translocase subunit SecA [Clostridiaceae]MBC5787460.1 preprotein translocase subunit SecA [Clostridium facile]PWN00319.1 MAG: preprotein translocase subunit SecA [Massilioclostridium sp.]
MGLLDKIFGSYSEKEVKRIKPLMQKVLDLEPKYKEMSESELKDQTNILKKRLADGETTDDILPEAFAVCREASDRVLGMRHFPVQIIGGIVLHQGRIAEMRTGEGKTLVATLPAYLNGLTGKGVHIVTVNDYLAKRDSEWMGKVYRYLGLTVGLIVHDLDNDARRKAYNCDITYGTNNELGFDYLRDNMCIYKEQKVQREFYYAVVDEVDSILIDEARTPLIISGQGDKSTELYTLADRFAKTLTVHKVAELDDKEEQESVDEDADYIVDEKAKTATLTQKGVKKAEEYFHVENIMDAENSTLLHHINQAIRAYGIMRRDSDYVVKDGEVIIVDEFTGRLMIGRRYNEGLHQAIEAKEGVKVARESKTLATITFQNFFRLYKKLSGMTGTAMTEEGEFREIYKLDVVEIPTNNPVQRKDYNDVVYKTEQGKFNAVIEQIIECHEKGQPVLVGTVTIEKSELLSSMLKRRGVKHEVLNAKFHEKEAEIVAQAGKKGAVTIATNMAGRGTDIMLGGNAEFMAKAEMRKKGYTEELIAEATSYGETDNQEILEARETFQKLNKKHKDEIAGEAEEVKEAGGLFIIGTERHDSRRIDNQLRGRSGRQGDPGASRFYLSLEDDLMRLFGGEKLQAMMNALKIEEDQPIENKMLTNSIESAQRKVEGRNFSIRKSVLQYDDVMNSQRELIYAQRNKVLNGENLRDYIVNMIKDMVSETVDRYVVETEVHDDWNIEGLKNYFLHYILEEDDLVYTPQELEDETIDHIKEIITEKALAKYEAKEQEVMPERMRELERVVLLKVVDSKWMDHIDAMDELKRGITLRAYAQRDPVIEYRIEGFNMFDDMIASIKEDTVRLLLTVRIRSEEEPKREQVAKPTGTSGGSDTGAVSNQPVRKTKVGRNDPCPCGSGKKYKKCCGRDENTED